MTTSEGEGMIKEEGISCSDDMAKRLGVIPAAFIAAIKSLAVKQGKEEGDWVSADESAIRDESGISETYQYESRQTLRRKGIIEERVGQDAGLLIRINTTKLAERLAQVEVVSAKDIELRGEILSRVLNLPNGLD